MHARFFSIDNFREIYWEGGCLAVPFPHFWSRYGNSLRGT